MIQPTSMLARKELLDSGIVNSQMHKVWILLRWEPMTIRELSQVLNLVPGTISARLNDLRKIGRVKEGRDCKKRKCSI